MEKANKSNELNKLMFVIGIVVLLFIGYMIVKNYKMVSSGEMQRIEKLSKRKRKNKEYWDASEIG